MAAVSKIQTQLDINFNECEPMTKINCASDLKFSLTGVSTYYPPSSLPTTGTATLSNKPGSVTAPPSGSVFSYTNGGDKVVYTITAASAGKGGDSGSGGGSGSQPTGSASGTGAAATTAKKGMAGSVSVQKGFMVTISVLAMAVGLASW